MTVKEYNQKRILILSNSAKGLYDFRFELIQRIINEGIEIFLSLPEPEGDIKAVLLKQSGAKYIQTYINRRGMHLSEDIKLIKRYNEIIKEVRPDLILTYTIKPNIYGSYVAGKYKIPVLMNITGIGSSLQNSKIKSLIKLMYRYACSKGEVVFFQNNANRDFFVSNHMVEKDKTKLVPGSGVNISKFIPLEKSNDDGKIKFLFSGRIMKEKGIDDYLAVAESITKMYNNTEFQILGYFEEPAYKYLEKDTKNPAIKYIGLSADVRKEVKDVDCIVNPSYHEGMSNVLLEGAAMGKTLIASNIPGCKEIIEEGKNGFLFDVRSAQSLKEKIIHFLELTPKERLLMGQYSRQKAEAEFDRNIVISEYLNIFNSILDKDASSILDRQSL